MKITKLTAYSVHTNQFRNFNFVRVDTDEGIHGVGELFGDVARAGFCAYYEGHNQQNDKHREDYAQRQNLFIEFERSFYCIHYSTVFFNRPGPEDWL